MPLIASIENSLIGSGQSLRNQQQPFTIPLPTNDWKDIRINMRAIFSTPPAALPAGGPTMFLGLCSGSSEPFNTGNIATANAIGFYFNTWSSYSANGQFCTAGAAKREGTTTTAFGAKSYAIGFDTTKRLAYSVLIQRAVFGGTGGSASYNVDMYNCKNVTLNVDYDDDNFYHLCSATYTGATWSFAQHDDYQVAVTNVDEDSNGTFDHVNFYWDCAYCYADIHDFNVHVVT